MRGVGGDREKGGRMGRERRGEEQQRPTIRQGAGFCYDLHVIVQELCESGGGRPELSVPTSLLASVDVKLC